MFTIRGIDLQVLGTIGRYKNLNFIFFKWWLGIEAVNHKNRPWSKYVEVLWLSNSLNKKFTECLFTGWRKGKSNISSPLLVHILYSICMMIQLSLSLTTVISLNLTLLFSLGFLMSVISPLFWYVQLNTIDKHLKILI